MQSNLRPERETDLQAMFREYAATGDIELRNKLVGLHQRLVHHFAGKLSRGTVMAYDDLVQVGNIGLITAIDRFDPNRGHAFVTFAAPTIVGVIKRYLRDHTWALKVPRRLRELGISLRAVREQLESRYGRPPSVSEVAAAAGVTEELVVEALELERAYNVQSLDVPRPEAPGEDAGCGWEGIGSDDPVYGFVELRESLRTAIGALEKRQRFIIYQRFYGEASQSQVAEQLGLSQMHVSRLERQALRRLKADLAGDPPPEPSSRKATR